MAENVFSIHNQWWTGTEAERIAYTPVLGTYGVRWFTTDSLTLYVWENSAWVQIGDNSGISRVASTFLMLPNLRALWTMASVTEANVVSDASGQARTIAPGTAPVFTFGNTYVPYSAYTRASSQYLTRASEAGLNTFAGGLTVYSWCWWNVASSGALTGVVSKWENTVGNQRGYRLYKLATNQINAEVSGTGANVFGIGDGVANYGTGAWFLLVLRFVPSTSVDLYVNNNKYTNAVGLPASLHPSTESLDFGRTNRGNYLDGRIAISAVCAQNHTDGLIDAVWQNTRRFFGR